jgi:hypothetical protein
MAGTEPWRDTTMRRWKSLSTGAKYIFAATCVAGAFAATTTDTKADGMAAKGRPAAGVYALPSSAKHL